MGPAEWKAAFHGNSIGAVTSNRRSHRLLVRCNVSTSGFSVTLRSMAGTTVPFAQPLCLGGLPSLVFLNTLFGPDGQQAEMSGNGRALVDWLIAAGLIDASVAARLPRKFGDEV